VELGVDLERPMGVRGELDENLAAAVSIADMRTLHPFEIMEFP